MSSQVLLASTLSWWLRQQLSFRHVLPRQGINAGSRRTHLSTHTISTKMITNLIPKQYLYVSISTHNKKLTTKQFRLERGLWRCRISFCVFSHLVVSSSQLSALTLLSLSPSLPLSLPSFPPSFPPAAHSSQLSALASHLSPSLFLVACGYPQGMGTNDNNNKTKPYPALSQTPA